MAAKKPVKQVEITAELETLIGEWFSAGQSLERAVARENELRLQVFSNFYKADDPCLSEPGTEHFAMPGNWLLKIERRINTKVDQSLIGAIKTEIATLEADPDSGELPTIDAALKWKPDFSESGYRDLRDDVKVILNKALTRTPGTPGIKLELPKSVQAKATGVGVAG